MNLINGIRSVLDKIQYNKASHQQQIKVLNQIYEKVPIEEFFEVIKNILKMIFLKNTISIQNNYVERVLDFLAHFVAEVTPMDDSVEDFTDSSSHPFLTMIIKETLRYHDLINECLRYNSCLFVKLILQYIGNNKNLDNEVCDLIQDAMLERTSDPKSAVRLQSVSALIRLQDPLNPDCPVIKAYLSLIVDPKPQIRAEVVKSIAPSSVTIVQIINRLQDIDVKVRMSAFRRCADFGPKNFKIIERQRILQCGVTERHNNVKNVFIQNLFPKWLHAYSNDYLSFLNGLKLDADENDITNTENITNDVIKLLLELTPLNEIISILPLNEEKVLLTNSLTSEAISLWNLLVGHLRGNDTLEDYVEQIIPDLTPFCNYIESIIKEKDKQKMEDWEVLDYQYILDNLFGIVDGYDLADEVGRRTLHRLTLNLLKTENLQLKLKKKIVSLAFKSSQKTDDFTSTICNVISDIQEPFIEKQVELNPVEETNKECQKAEIKVNIIRLEADLEEALDDQEFLKADALKKDIIQLKQKLQEMSTENPTVEMVRVTKDDPKTICDCLDILMSLLKLRTISTMTPSLVTIKDEFVVPLLNSNVSEIHWRVLECLSLFCYLEQNLVEEYIKVLCIPIITYRAIPNYNKHALMVSVKAVSDIIRLYGPNIFGSREETLNGTHQSANATKRRLYRSEDSDENIMLSNRFHLETIIEVILDMLDDELAEIRNTSLKAITKLILNKFPVSSLLITRLILKWYNPLTAKASDNLQQLTGVVVGNYAKSNDEAKEVVAKSVIPIFQSIASAPRTSPLADIDIDNLILFLSTITTCNVKMDLNTHLNMAHMFIYEILKTKNPLMVCYLSKMLLNLNISTGNVSVIKELIAKVDATLESELDKNPKKNLCKFKQTLIAVLENQTRTNDTNLEITENSQRNSTSPANNTAKSAKNNDTSVSLNRSNGILHKNKTLNNQRTITNLAPIEEENTSLHRKSNNSQEENRNDTAISKSGSLNVSNTDSNLDHSDTNEKRRRISSRVDGGGQLENIPADSNSDKLTQKPHENNDTNTSIQNKNSTKKVSKKKNRRSRKVPNSIKQSSTEDEEEQRTSKRLKVTVQPLDMGQSSKKTKTKSIEGQECPKKLQVFIQPVIDGKKTLKTNTKGTEVREFPRKLQVCLENLNPNDQNGQSSKKTKTLEGQECQKKLQVFLQPVIDGKKTLKTNTKGSEVREFPRKLQVCLENLNQNGQSSKKTKTKTLEGQECPKKLQVLLQPVIDGKKTLKTKSTGTEVREFSRKLQVCLENLNQNDIKNKGNTSNNDSDIISASPNSPVINNLSKRKRIRNKLSDQSSSDSDSGKTKAKRQNRGKNNSTVSSNGRRGLIEKITKENGKKESQNVIGQHLSKKLPGKKNKVIENGNYLKENKIVNLRNMNKKNLSRKQDEIETTNKEKLLGRRSMSRRLSSTEDDLDETDVSNNISQISDSSRHSSNNSSNTSKVSQRSRRSHSIRQSLLEVEHKKVTVNSSSRKSKRIRNTTRKL